MFPIYLKIILSNWAFWVSFIGILGFLLFDYFTKKKLTWIQSLSIFGASLLIVPLTTLVCFQTNSNTDDFCHNGSYVTSAHYKQGYTKEWDTIETRTVDDGNGKSHTETYTKHHVEHVPPVWWAKTSEGKEFHISSSDYNNYVNFFGSNIFEHLINTNQTSSGDGNAFHSMWNPKYPIMPVSYNYPYVNYIKASKRTILRQKGLDITPFKDLLMSYPNVYSEGYGPIALDRVIVRGVNVPKEWVKQVNYALAVFTAKKGATYQINPQVYIVGTDNVSFANVLRQEWIGGKKNDAILVVGAKQWPKIDWVDVIHWSKKSEFGIIWKDSVLDADFSNPNTVLQGLDQAVKHYQRRSFKEYRYLLTDVEIPFWANLIVLIFNVGLVVGFVIFLEQSKSRQSFYGGRYFR